MKPEICPYLGQSDDPTTALGFPSPGNFCHRARPVAPVNLSHQSNYCRTGGHVDCPVYRSAHTRPLPAAISAERSRSFPTRQVLAIAGLPLVAIALIAVYLAFPGLIPQVEGLRARLVPLTGKTQVVPTFGLFTIPDDGTDGTYSPFSLGVNTPTSPPVRPDCPLPAGWTTYVVNPTDSFYRLSVVYNITVENLQQNNCMGKETAIEPGQVIYVPILPTLTPTATPLPKKYSLFPTNTLLPGKLPPPILPATPVFAPISTPVPTATPLPPTFTNTPFSTITSFPTNRPSPTRTPSPTNKPFPTKTPFPTNTPFPTRTPLPTNTPFPTNTPLPPTVTPQPTSTLPPTATQTPRPTKTKKFDPTATQPPPTNTPLPTNTPFPTNTPLPTDTPMPTDTPQATNTQVVVLFTDTPAPAPSATDPIPPEPSPTPSDTPTANQPASPEFIFAMLPNLRRA